MRFPSKEIVARVRRQYPAGCRVELTHILRTIKKGRVT